MSDTPYGCDPFWDAKSAPTAYTNFNGIEIILDASQIESFERCPRAWYYSYVRNLQPKLSKKSFDIGSYFHEVLAHYYENSKQLEITYRIADALKFARTPSLQAKFNINDVERQNFYLERLRDYFYRNFDEDESSETIAVEKGFSSLLYEDAKRRYILEGKIDHIVVRQGLGLCIEDHKTQSRASVRWPTNHQLLNYFRVVQPNYFIYNYIGLQEKIVKDTFHRDIHKPTLEMVAQWEKEVRVTFDEMYNMLTNLGYDYNFGSKEHEDAFPRRRTACDGKYGVCQMHHICSIEDGSRFRSAVESMYEIKKEKWSAWK